MENDATSLRIDRIEHDITDVRTTAREYVSKVHDAAKSVAIHRERLDDLERRAEVWDAMRETVVEIKTTIRNGRWVLGFVVALSSALAAFAGVAAAFAALR